MHNEMFFFQEMNAAWPYAKTAKTQRSSHVVQHTVYLGVYEYVRRVAYAVCRIPGQMAL